MKAAEYPLAQCVAMLNWLAEQEWDHLRLPCEECKEAMCCAAPDEDYCATGQRFQVLRRKWKRRCKAAAKREGVKMTV